MKRGASGLLVSHLQNERPAIPFFLGEGGFTERMCMKHVAQGLVVAAQSLWAVYRNCELRFLLAGTQGRGAMVA